MRSITMPRVWVYAVCIIITFGIAALMSAASRDPTNQLKGSLTIHDPSSLLMQGGTYYTFGTGGGGLISKDRITWSRGDNPISRMGKQSWWAVHGGDIWAPECALMDGVYYFFYSVSAWMEFNSAIGVATNTTLDQSDSDYRWADQGVVIDSLQAADGGPMVNVIDPATFFDDDGKWYLIFGSFQGGIRLIELNRATGKPLTETVHPVKITDHLGEASFLLHLNDYYYCTVSTGICCKAMESTYQIVQGRATSVVGPYTNREGRSFKTGSSTGLLSRDYDSDGSVLHAGMGCSGFFWDRDTLFMSYHAYTAPDGAALLNIKPVYLDPEGWLTMDPSEGTIITGEKSAISRAGLNAPPTGQCRSPFAKRLFGDGTAVRSAGRFYSIDGKRVDGPATGRLPFGVYIEIK
ncbi:MAG: arabinan endo-1,5-alpha-L-arabinosidase [Chitinispirillaceae bacterium]|nr:arabinan endo-1,5-alpha-L-arabinosidase [Chitinispirillaceae bacterium]